jgi:hypothetical protein
MPDYWSEIRNLKPEKQKLLLDVIQVALAVGGIFEPTPICDGTNAAISLYRRDWFGAVVSAVAVVPYVGDLAKAGRLGKYAKTIEEAIRVATRDMVFRRLLTPVLGRIVRLCEALPYAKLPDPVRKAVDLIYHAASQFPRAAGTLSKLDHTANELLGRIYGSTKNVGLMPRDNIRTIIKFFETSGVDMAGRGGKIISWDERFARWAEKCKAIDLHKPVTEVTLSKGDRLATYVEMSKPAEERIGQWLVRERGAVSHRNLGLAAGDRQRIVVEVTKTRRALSSSSNPLVDTWTSQRLRQVTVPVRGGHAGGELVTGGGTQFFLPDAYKFVTKVAGPE